MKQNKGFAQLLVIVVIGVLLVGGIAYVVAKNPRDVANNTDTTPPPAGALPSQTSSRNITIQDLVSYFNSTCLSWKGPGSSGACFDNNFKDIESGADRMFSTSNYQLVDFTGDGNLDALVTLISFGGSGTPPTFFAVSVDKNKTVLLQEMASYGCEGNCFKNGTLNLWKNNHPLPSTYESYRWDASLKKFVSITPTLTQSAALALVKSTWGGCDPNTCSEVIVSVSNQGSSTYVTATYEGLRDDSSSAQRKVAIATYTNGKWTLGEPTVTQRCQPGRGHQDFSAELCI